MRARARVSLVFWLALAVGCGGVSEPVHEATPVSIPRQTAAADAPTIVLVSIDTLRADRLGCYGCDRPTSPKIDRFRQQAVLFEQAIAHAPSTLPSHASMLTSMLPLHHGASFQEERPLPPAIPTLAEVLQAAGYRTAAFTGGGQLAPEFGLDQGFDVYRVVGGSRRFHETVRAGLQWLEDDLSRPAFLFLHTYEVHHPYTPEPEFLKLVEDDYPGSLPDRISKKLLRRINNGAVSIDDDDLAHIVATYDAEIRSVDKAFGRLRGGLRELGLWQEAFVIVTSDHGEEFGEHGAVGWHSHSLYDELLRVPLLIRFPRWAHGGETVQQQVRLIDIPPTVVAAAGLRAPSSFDGVDLATVIVEGSAPLAAVSQQDTPTKIRRLSLRTEDRKLYPRELLTTPLFGPPRGLWRRVVDAVHERRAPFALFDLAVDPGETTDVAGDRGRETGSLRKQLEQEMARRPAVAAPGSVAVDDLTEEQLRALGYIE